MTEINGPKFSVNQVNFSGIQKSQGEVPSENLDAESSQVSDLADANAASVGRSMLFKGSDNVNNDLKVLLKNPQLAENSDKLFEALYSAASKSGMAHPYEEAASASTVAM